MFEKAAEMYSQAIQFYPGGHKNCAVFYSNRAACYANLNQYDRVIQDCTMALEADPMYVKAMLRRANAHEKTGKLTDSLHGTLPVLVSYIKIWRLRVFWRNSRIWGQSSRRIVYSRR